MTNADRSSELLAALKWARQEIAKLQREKTEPIAVVGMGCRFPGAVDSPDAYWSLLRTGGEPRANIATRWSQGNKPEETCWGYLHERALEFEPLFFHISPREAHAVDPQQRLLLETVADAVDHAGLSVPRDRRRPEIGVYAGCGLAEFNCELSARGETIPSELEPFMATGMSGACIAGRVSYVFGFGGPCLTVDTACSSSLVAVHLACAALRAGTIQVAVAGGVNALVSSTGYAGLKNLGALAPDGRCKSFDASGDGYGRGEGCGVVVLKRLADAQRDGDRIWAVIRGSAVNQDGVSTGLTVPNMLAQAEVIKAALDAAGVSPGDVQYVEAHGTGTMLGDPIEVDALNEVFGASHSAAHPLVIGAVKSNIGHLEGAAGVSSLIKAILMINHREVPASLHFKKPNPHIPWAEVPVRVQSELGAWPAPDKALIAGVSSFGFSGTNAHVIVAEAPAESSPARAKVSGPHLLAVSAKTPEGLALQAERFATYLDALPDGVDEYDVSATSLARRTHHEHRLVVAGDDATDWKTALRTFAKDRATGPFVSVANASSPKRRIAFVFGGQGGQWPRMARGLYEGQPVFRKTIDACHEAMRKVEPSWSLLDELAKGEDGARLEETAIAQPAIFAVQVALVELLRSWGIEPEAAVGHSIGEVAAAHVAGVLDLEEACKLVCLRGRVMQKAPPGAMAAVRLGAAEAEAIVKGSGGKISLGAINAPTSIVLSGDRAPLEEALKTLAQRDVWTRELRVQYAFHSHHVESLMDELRRALGSIQPRQPRLTVVSTLTGTDTAAWDAKYWAEQMRSPVKFEAATRVLLERGFDMFVEIGPHPVLTESIEEIAADASKSVAVVPTLRRAADDRKAMLQALGGMHVHGCAIEWSRAFPERARVATLPAYPWQRQAFPIPGKRGSTKPTGPWPFVQVHVASSADAGQHTFEATLSLADPTYAYLGDHLIHGSVWMPATAYFEMVFEAAEVIAPERPATLERVSFAEALLLAESKSVVVQISLTAESERSYAFSISSRAADEVPFAWVRHATGRLTIDDASSTTAPGLGELKRSCREAINCDELYRTFEQAGWTYGATFRAVAEAWRGDGCALGRLAGGADGPRAVDAYIVHPALFDAALQVGGAAQPAEALTSRPRAPSSTARVRKRGRGRATWAFSAVKNPEPEVWESYTTVFDESGKPVIEVEGFRLVPLDDSETDPRDRWLFHSSWRPSPLPESPSRDGRWLILADESGVGQQLAAALEPGRATLLTRSDVMRRGASGDEQLVSLLQETFGSEPPRAIVYAWALDATEKDLLEKPETITGLTFGAPYKLAQAIGRIGWSKSPRLFMLTRGAQSVRGRDIQNPQQALLWGLAATLAHETSQLSPTMIDLDDAPVINALANALAAGDDETRVALRKDERFVERVARRRTETASGVTRRLTVGRDSYELHARQLGEMSSLVLRAAARPEPPPGMILLRTKATGLNFRDALTAMGVVASQGRPVMGGECVGVVEALGAGVEGPPVGTEVIAICENGFDAFVTVPPAFVVEKPRELSVEQAAAMPALAMSVVYSLEHLTKIAQGNLVLVHVHAATSGLASIVADLARNVGATVFATAGTEAEREYLRAMGVAHVYDVTVKDWPERIRSDSGGRGMDIVFNSLVTERDIRDDLSVLAPFGTILRLGVRDANVDRIIGTSRPDASVGLVILPLVIAQRPEWVPTLLRRAIDLAAKGTIRPLTVHTYPVSRVVDAFQNLVKAGHIGKMVITSEDAVDVLDESRSELVRDDKTYVVTGGFGRRGLVAAESLARLGARHIVLLDGASPVDAARERLEKLQATGANVRICVADLSDRASLTAALGELAGATPPIGGVVHAASVDGDDGDRESVHTDPSAVLRARLVSAALLDGLSGAADLFVCFSSSSRLLGAPGNALDSASAAFASAFAATQASRGKRALSVSWSAWSHGAHDKEATLMGLEMIGESDAAHLFEQLLRVGGGDPVVVPFDFAIWSQIHPRLAGVRLLSELASEGRAQGPRSGVLEQVRAAATPQAALSVVRDWLVQVVAKATRVPVADLSIASAPLKQLGFDSLMTVTMKHLLERELSLRLSTATLYSYPTVDRLAPYLLERVGGGSASSASTKTASQPDPAPAAPARVVEVPSEPAPSEDSIAAGLEELRKRGIDV